MTFKQMRTGSITNNSQGVITAYFFENSFTREAETAEQMKKAVLFSLLFILALLWAPMPFHKRVITTPEVITKPNKHAVLKLPPLLSKKPVKVREKKKRRVPMPSRTPPLMEIAPTPEALPEPELIDTALELDFDPGAPPHSGEAVPLNTPGLERPIIIQRVPPIYPSRAAELGLQGYVTVEALMKADGTIDEVKVVRGLGRGKFGFEEAAMRAVKDWRFLPGKLDGRAVDVFLVLKIEFVLTRN